MSAGKNETNKKEINEKDERQKSFGGDGPYKDLNDLTFKMSLEKLYAFYLTDKKDRKKAA